jgi:hypothetical protein
LRWLLRRRVVGDVVMHLSTVGFACEIERATEPQARAAADWLADHIQRISPSRPDDLRASNCVCILTNYPKPPPLSFQQTPSNYRQDVWRSRRSLQVCAPGPRTTIGPQKTNISKSTLIRSNGVFLSTIFVGAFATNMYDSQKRNSPGMNTGLTGSIALSTSAPTRSGTLSTRAYVSRTTDILEAPANTEVQRQWKDIKHKYMESEDDE